MIAPAGRTPTTLVMVNDPRNLNWRGRSNLYSQIGAYLVAYGKEQQRSPITNFAAWEQGTSEPREVGSRLSVSSVWEATDPAKALSQENENPTRVFQLNPRITASADFGARQGPFGSSLRNFRLAQRAADEPDETPVPARRVGEGEPARSQGAVNSADTAPTASVRPTDDGAAETAGESSAGLSPMDPMNLPSMPPMPSTPSSGSSESVTQSAVAVQTASPPLSVPRAEAASTQVETTPAPARLPVAQFADEDLIRSSEQFVSMFKQLGRKGGGAPDRGRS